MGKRVTDNKKCTLGVTNEHEKPMIRVDMGTEENTGKDEVHV